jgi:hypothetical protein
MKEEPRGRQLIEWWQLVPGRVAEMVGLRKSACGIAALVIIIVVVVGDDGKRGNGGEEVAASATAPGLRGFYWHCGGDPVVAGCYYCGCDDRGVWLDHCPVATRSAVGGKRGWTSGVEDRARVCHVICMGGLQCAVRRVAVGSLL